ncbi:uncharacterized protein LOC119465269 isoform X2 [Dermacentor silvarum]|uniref:uncharacterized protein LOC119465269 isoform X2 n=1 Tax=Dermacentor silvarum TaxID=543639 RepID=UPI002100BFA0|nr:uncharacterized protein LOC119465269 isoform X2 [Dermacentor silvarum]XP_049512350.1 uncharacterized protein LOC119465269 isoform X2 [Dermacentor silvarum]
MKWMCAALFLLSTCSMRCDGEGWGCPKYNIICDFLCKVQGYAYGYCNNQPERDGCHCVNKTSFEFQDGKISKKYLQDSGRYVEVLEGHGCPKISNCAIVCLVNGGDFSLCSQNAPYHCYCYLHLRPGEKATNGTVLYTTAAPTTAMPTTAPPATVSPAVSVRDQVCPMGGPICELYCQLDGSPFGYCIRGKQQCHCVSPQLQYFRGADTSYKYYLDRGHYVKQLNGTYSCPKLQDCAAACLMEHRATFAVCGRNPPNLCYCYIKRH